MITVDISQTYIPLTGVLLLISGAMLLLTDVKAYQKRNMAKEQAWARWLGVINLGLGGITLVASWVAGQWLW